MLKTPAIDASSAILLFKAGLLEIFLSSFTTVTTQSVIEETLKGEKGENIGSLLSRNSLLKEADESGVFGPGENSILALYENGFADSVISDDGEFLRHCRSRDITHYSSIMIPWLLFKSSKLSREKALAYTAKLESLGRYADWVLEYVENQWGNSS